MNAVHFRRIDPRRSMRRFYQLAIEKDLLGGVRLVKTWGRVGTIGRCMAEHHDDEAVAAEALQQQVAKKRRRGYGAW
jgi:predicted DNA-binding WGR domain protein